MKIKIVTAVESKKLEFSSVEEMDRELCKMAIDGLAFIAEDENGNAYRSVVDGHGYGRVEVWIGNMCLHLMEHHGNILARNGNITGNA